jgi:hypothetical protein
MAEQNAELGDDQQNTKKLMGKTIERAVAQALREQFPQLQALIVQRLLETLPAEGTGVAAPSGEDSGTLVQALSQIHAGSTQKEILRALLDAGSAHCSRIALFVVKSGVASGWQARGLGANEAVTDLPLDLHNGPAARAYQNRVAAPGNIAEMDRRFVELFSGPANQQVLILPLTLKEKVAALIYADGGDTGRLDAHALELLVMATGAWLEVTSLRKQAAARLEGETAVPLSRPAAPVQTVSAFSDPFAAHSPKHVPAGFGSQSESVQAENTHADSISTEPPRHERVWPGPAQPTPPAEIVELPTSPAHAASAAAAPAAARDPWDGLSPEDADVHRKAQRFARLLVDEIKLYNQAKVAEGRRHRDLYDRLKEDIEKSRGSFQKRYGSTVAASADYFQHELVHSLAEDDVSVMGAHFR